MNNLEGQMKQIRFTETDILNLLASVAQDPANFEKPKARVYYKVIQDFEPSLRKFNWTGLRDKMRMLRMSYQRAVGSRQGFAQSPDAQQADIEAAIFKICPYYSILDDIFRNRVSIRHSYYKNESESSHQSDLDGAEIEYLEQQCEPDNLIIKEEPEIQEEYSPKSKIPKMTECDEKQLNNSDSGKPLSIAQLVEVQKQKNMVLIEKLELQRATQRDNLIIERDKLEIERHRIMVDEKFRELEEASRQQNLKIEKERLEIERQRVANEKSLRELEIIKKYELEKLRMEHDVRLKELELQYKYRNE